MFKIVHGMYEFAYAKPRKLAVDFPDSYCHEHNFALANHGLQKLLTRHRFRRLQLEIMDGPNPDLTLYSVDCGDRYLRLLVYLPKGKAMRVAIRGHEVFLFNADGIISYTREKGHLRQYSTDFMYS